MLLWKGVLYFVAFSLVVIAAGPLDNIKFNQNDYQIKFEWGELVQFNEHLMKVFKLRTFKYNRTCTAVNMTLEYKVPVGNDLELIVQAYKFASNEYRQFPARMQVNFCNGLRKNYVGSSALLKCGNFTGCPTPKDVRFHMCNWVPDPSQFPPFIPNGRYKLEAQGLYHDQELFVVNAFGEVSRPIVIK